MKNMQTKGEETVAATSFIKSETATQSKVAITLKLTPRELKVLEELAEKKELTKVAVIRQALRLYQLLDARLAQGEKVLVEDVSGEKKTELMML